MEEQQYPYWSLKKAFGMLKCQKHEEQSSAKEL